MEMNREKLVERFVRYTTFDTQSDNQNSQCPSTSGQMANNDYRRL